MLSDDEIRRRLNTIRFSSTHERNARRAVSINSIAKQAGMPRQYLYRIASGHQQMGPRSRGRLVRVFSDLSD